MAVYTELAHSDIVTFVARYDLPPVAEAEGIRAGVENTNYRVTVADGVHYILTLFEKRVSLADLPFFVELMGRLASQGVPCPMPLASHSGDVILFLKEKPAVLVTFLAGGEATAIHAAHMSELGAHMARMHLAAHGMRHSRANALSPAGWPAIAAKIMPHAVSILPSLPTEIAGEIEEVTRRWPADLPRGVIHADLFPDNVFFQGERLSGIIDFYFACNDMLAYELAICLNAWCFEKNLEFNITRARAMLRGYHAVRPITPAELDALPVLARGAALRFLLTRAHDWLFPVEGALVTPKDPMEYLKKLRFHQQVRHHGEYGL